MHAKLNELGVPFDIQLHRPDAVVIGVHELPPSSPRFPPHPQWLSFRSAVTFLEAESVAAAEAVLRLLPMPRDGLIDFEFFALQTYDHFELLFRDEYK